MKLHLLPLVAVALTAVTANPIAAPIAEAEALAEAAPISFPPAADPEQLFKRADKTCKVYDGDGAVACRTGAGTGYKLKYRVNASYRFGVRCKANGSSVYGNKVWDWIPGWGCWISAYYTRPTGGSSSCESGVPWC